MLTNGRAEAESTTAAGRRWEEPTHGAEETSESLRVVRAPVGELKAERAMLTAETQQEMARCDMLAAFFGLEVAVSTHLDELDVMMRSVRSKNERMAAGENRANITEAQARETLDKISKLWAFVEVLNQFVDGMRACVAGLVGAYLVGIRSVISAALSENKGTVSEAICEVREGFPDEESCNPPRLSAGGSYDYPYLLVIV